MRHISMYATSQTSTTSKTSKTYSNPFQPHYRNYRNSMPSPPLPMHIPSKTGVPLRHLLLHDHTSNDQKVHAVDSGPTGPLILTACITMLVTVFVTVVCIFILWRWHNTANRATKQMQTTKTNQFCSSDGKTPTPSSTHAPSSISLQPQ